MILRQKNNLIDKGLYQKDAISFDNLKDREVLKVILQKKGKFRSKKELLYIRKFFSSFKIFQDMEKFLTNQLMISLCKELMYFSKSEDEVVFYEGDIGKKFYIIIDGEVEVLEEQNRSQEVVKLRAEITQKQHLEPEE